MRGVLHPEQIEESEAQRDTDRDLKSTGQQDRGAARRHLSQVDLETDHEEQQDETDLGHGRDALLVRDEPQADVGPDDHARGEVGDDQRLVEAPGDRSDQRGETDADADARQQVGGNVHRAATLSGSPQRSGTLVASAGSAKTRNLG